MSLHKIIISKQQGKGPGPLQFLDLVLSHILIFLDFLTLKYVPFFQNLS